MKNFYCRRFAGIISIIFSLCMFLPAQGPELIEESFDYDVGSEIDGQGEAAGGWDGVWEYSEGNTGTIIVYPGTILEDIPAQRVGNYVELTTEESSADAAAYRYLNPPVTDDGQTFWISLLYQRIDADNDADPSYNGFSLYQDDTELLYIGKPWAFTQIGAVAHGASGDNYDIDSDARDGAWIVIKFAMNGTEDNDSAYCYINPDPNTEPAQKEANFSFDWLGSNGFNRVRLGCNYQCWAAFDEIKMAATYAELNNPVSGIFTSPVGNLPYRFQLEQNYPNPFNPSTTISYNVPIQTEVRIAVYDILGKEVTTLVNTVKMPGTYQVSFNASQLTSGIYFYQMRAGSYSQTRKMMLLE
jgi:hypothetical protein